MVEDKSTITINDENPNVEVPTNSSTTEEADVTSNIEGTNASSKTEETPKSEVSTDTSEIKVAETTSDVEEVDTTSKSDDVTKSEGTITSDETGIETETETEESTVNDVMQGNDTEPKQEPEESTANNAIQENNDESTVKSTPTPKLANVPAKAPAKEPKKTDDVEPWDDDAPVSEDDLIDELFYHGGIAKDVAKDMIEKLKAAKDAKLKADMINHIVWHIATGGPTNKTNGGKGKALHKKDILDYLKTL